MKFGHVLLDVYTCGQTGAQPGWNVSIPSKVGGSSVPKWLNLEIQGKCNKIYIPPQTRSKSTHHSPWPGRPACSAEELHTGLATLVSLIDIIIIIIIIVVTRALMMRLAAGRLNHRWKHSLHDDIVRYRPSPSP